MGRDVGGGLSIRELMLRDKDLYKARAMRNVPAKERPRLTEEWANRSTKHEMSIFTHLGLGDTALHAVLMTGLWLN